MNPPRLICETTTIGVNAEYYRSFISVHFEMILPC
jgi:hypothetical protein